MTEHKFTDEEVIKALECCSSAECEKCKYVPQGDCYQGSLACNDDLMRSALDLINRQKAEIAFWQDAAANAERETAREIFEKFIIISESPYRIHIIVEKEEFDELKKKYGVTDKNVGCKIEEEKA